MGVLVIGYAHFSEGAHEIQKRVMISRVRVTGDCELSDMNISK